MNRFHTVRDAKEYLIQRILAQADRDGVPLSEVERKMLYFSETGWTLPDMMAVGRAFDQTYDQNEYEDKIGQVIQRIRNQPESDNGLWDEAVERLPHEDHYLLVLIDAALKDRSRSSKFSRWEILKLILASFAVLAIYAPFAFFLYSHVDNPTIAKLIGGSTLLGLAVLAAFLGNRRRRKSI